MIRVDGNPKLDRIAEYLALRRYNWTFGRGFSDLTPDTVEACVARVQSGAWRMIHVFVADQFAALHFIHDMDAATKSAWVSGYLDEALRGHGKPNLRLKQAVAAAAHEYFHRHWGYERLYGYCLASNAPGIQWVREGCEWVPAGMMEQAVPVNGVLEAIELHTELQVDIQSCREHAARLFPRGVFTK